MLRPMNHKFMNQQSCAKDYRVSERDRNDATWIIREALVYLWKAKLFREELIL